MFNKNLYNLFKTFLSSNMKRGPPKLNKKDSKKKEKEKETINTKEPHLQDQHLVFLFPIKFEQFVHVL